MADRTTNLERPLRLAELLATVSLATDLAHDVRAESALRDAVLAVGLGRLAGWPDADLSDVYYLALLYHVGCTGAVDIQSRFGATFTQEGIARPMLRLGLPVMRDMMWRFGIPMFAGRGFRNLLTLAEARARSVQSAIA